MMSDLDDVHDNDYLMISDGYYLDELLMMTTMMIAMMVHDDDRYDV